MLKAVSRFRFDRGCPVSDVLRWICDQYRSRLNEVDPQACHEVDLIMARAGQEWVYNQTVVNPDEVMTAHDIERLYGIREFQVRYLARRYGVEIRGKEGKANLYRLGDVLAARAGKLIHK